jgi:hypothetical protein
MGWSSNSIRTFARRRLAECSAGLAGLCLLAAVDSARAQSDVPWRSLFNGKDLSGWTIKGGQGKAWVENGEIVCHMVTNSPEHTFVCTTEKFGDFILEADCKIDGEVHTGFMLRSQDAPPEAKIRLLAYQVKIDPTSRRWTGGIFDDFGPNWTWLYTLSNNLPAQAAFDTNGWNHFRMEAIGPSIKTWVNGVPAANLIDDKYTDGYIALKIHQLNTDASKEKIFIRFKNIRVLTQDVGKYATPMTIPVITTKKEDHPGWKKP